MASCDAALGVLIKCPSSLQSPAVWLVEDMCHQGVGVRLYCCRMSGDLLLKDRSDLRYIQIFV